MGSPPPPHRTFAARAAYFGDRMCAFCDHRNPAGAKFCNDCASPLHLKPCSQCDAVNHQTTTNCYKCGAACPVLFGTSEATSVLPAADLTPVWARPSDVALTATETEAHFAASALRADGRLLRPGQLVLAGIATILIAGAYAAYRINAATPDAMAIASQPIGAREHEAPTATSAVPMPVELEPVEPERTAPVQAPILATNPEAPKRASERQRPVPVPATKHASAHQRSVPERQARVGAPPPVAHSLAATRVGARVAETPKALRPDRLQLMNVNLARCGGDLIARIVCHQRVRGHFCEGHWGGAPECASAVAYDHRP
jgi:ribosomal protein L40E